MKTKNGFILRKLGKEYMVVAIGEAGKSFNGMIRMNEAGEWLWNQMKEDISKDELVNRMCSYYDKLSQETAEADLVEFLETVKAAIEE
ncbi:MAG: PqqD family protein [Eubacteriales bacterium]|nr:PqqD family protein [Eubacteriales bacterium]